MAPYETLRPKRWIERWNAYIVRHRDLPRQAADNGGEHIMGIVRTFSRGVEQMRVENRYDTQTAEFLLVIEHHDGYRETKRFAEALAYRAWLTAFEDQLEQQQWLLSEPRYSRS